MRDEYIEDLAESIARMGSEEIAALFVALASRFDYADRDDIADALTDAYFTGGLLIEDLASRLGNR